MHSIILRLNHCLPRISTAAALVGLCLPLVAQTTLLPGGSVPMPGVVLGPGAVVVASTPTPEVFLSGGFEFKLSSTVYSNVTSNPFGLGGMVFAYHLTNIAAPVLDPGDAWGITELSVFDFSGYSVAVGEEIISGVVPGPTERSADGSRITFTYPPRGPYVPPPPPIYVGEYSNILYVFTNASGYTDAYGTVINSKLHNAGTVDEVVFGNVEYQSVNPFGPTGAPVSDQASTGALMFLGLASIAFGARVRRGRAR